MKSSWTDRVSEGERHGDVVHDGVIEESRSYILDDLGATIPIGVLKGNWPSSDLLTDMLLLMVQEGLGFHAVVHPAVGASGLSSVYALGGCIDFDHPTHKRCQENETQVHVAVDAWIGSYAEAYRQFETDYPAISPVDLGSMGYAGYNRTYHNAKQYFDSISDIPVSELSPCNSTDFINPSRMGFYAEYSGDSGGVELQPDGTYIGVCPDGYWWLAPACRDNAAECIAVFTAGNGWKLQAMMQWTAAYGIPAAIGISADWASFVNHVRTVRSLFYWWVPDSTFIEMLPSQILFPRHSPIAWAKGDKSTGAAGVYVAKMASKNLQQKAQRVQEFVANINFELPEVQNLLLEFKRAGAGSARNVSCQWMMKDNRDKWESWVPIDTACFEGFGLIDGQGAFLDNRTDAAGCGLCPAGRASEEVVDVTGRTFRCAQCPPGHFQSKTYSTSCERCPKGSYSNSYGNVECQYCGQGFYEEQEAQTSCTKCPASRTTQLLGAISLASCVCTESHIDDGGVCTFCGDGLSCPLGSTLSLLQSVNDTGAQLPHVLGGYHSDPAAPLQVYKCQDNFCPGGSPGTCKGGRQGLTCGDCPADHYWASNECTRCGAVMWADDISAMQLPSSSCVRVRAAFAFLLQLFLSPATSSTAALARLQQSNGHRSHIDEDPWTCSGSGEHLVMQIVGSLVVLLAGLFFSGSCFAAWVAPCLGDRFRGSKWRAGVGLVLDKPNPMDPKMIWF
ncbi:unnamed protein product [Effrenium voratum]|nr:unnamed protein product [Effrenium voratum]